MKLFTKKYLPLFAMLISIIAIMATTIGCETAADDDATTVSPYYFYTDKAGVQESTGTDWKHEANGTNSVGKTTGGADKTGKYKEITATANSGTAMWSLAPPAENATAEEKAKLAAQLADLSKHTTLVFWAKGAADQKIHVVLGSLDSDNPADQTKAKQKMVEQTITAEWKKYEIALTKFTEDADNKVDLSLVGGISFVLTTTNDVLNLDEVYATK